MEIRRDIQGSKGRYVVDTGHGEAELTYSILSPSRIIADHTGVPDGARGEGWAERLVIRLVEDARAEGVTITALCPFVRAWSARHPMWAEVFDR